jgi:putative FmdB family regulatory protein
MPLYEYECDACAHRFEVIQKFSDAPITTCPVCGGSVHKLLSSPAIQFKGSGFYLTDYGRGTGKKEAAKGDSGEAKAGKTDGASAGGEGASANASASGDSKSKSSESKTGAGAESKSSGGESKSASGESKPATAPKTD